jgi:environmental stress-induced protein Ves
MIRHLTRGDYRSMAWANGLGQTVEMIRVDGPEGLLWRLSMASVVEDGDFSILPGIERNLTVLDGAGFRLTGAGIDLEARPLEPVAFPGDLAIRAEGLRGPSRDFNVMTARVLPRPQVRLLLPGRVASSGTLCLLCLAQGKGPLPGQRLGEHDLLITDEPVELDVPALAVRLEVPFPQP